VKRGPYAKVVARNGQLLERITVLKAEHPFWGYRHGGMAVVAGRRCKGAASIRSKAMNVRHRSPQ